MYLKKSLPQKNRFQHCFNLKWLFLSWLVFLSASTFGLVSTYTFSSSNSNYTSITGTTLYSASWDDGSSALLTIPFTFNYNGTNYTTLCINANGFITLGAVNADVYCGLQTSAINSIAGYGTDLVGASASSSIIYNSRGTAPNRQFVVQWTDCDHFGNSNQNHWTFQILLNETSNTVQVIWGSSTDVTALGANSCADAATESGNSGLLGSANTDFNIRSITNGTNTWTTSVAGANLTSVCNMSSTNVPALGTTFTWTPGTVVAMTYSSSTTVFLNTTLAVSQNTTGNQILQVKVVTAGTSPALSLTSLSLSTTGSTSPTSDITNAKVYFTGNSSSFSSATQFGSTAVAPNGAYTVSGSATLSEGTNYFWITYDIKSTAVIGDNLSGCCTQMIGSGTMGTRTPTVTCPAGSQTISVVGSWTALASLSPAANSGVMLLLSDGTVMCKTSSGSADAYGNTWNKLTPTINGSYVNGTWSTLAPMTNSRLYFSTQILKDGRVYVAGGEYGTGLAAGEVYNPLTNTWTMTPAPGANVSDANSAILEDGRVLQALVSGTLKGNVIYNPTTNTYVAGPSCIGIHNESSWVKLEDNSILMVDRLSTNSERYIPATNTWVVDATVPVQLYDPFGYELGVAILLPDGRAFFVGATGKTAYYTPSGSASPGSWAAGPDVPSGKGQPDAPGAMMVNGKILLSVSLIPTSANHFPPPTSFYEFDYLTNTYTLINAPGGGTSLNISSYVTNFTDLPDGKVLYSKQGSTQYYVYTPAGAPLAAGKPIINNVIANGCNAYTITGTKFNGISEGACYGDDWQMASNYPVIRLTSGSNVYYVRTFNWNSTGVRRSSVANTDTTQFTIPAAVPAGNYSLVVTANGIASDPVAFTVSSSASLSSTLTPPFICTGNNFTYTPTSIFSTATFTWTRAAVVGISNSAITTPQASNPNEVLINTTSSAVDVVYSYVTTASGCNSTTQSVTVTVDPNLPLIGSVATTQCNNSSVNIPFTVNCNYTSGNVFTAQLSNSVGSFSAPTNIGTLTSTVSGTINAFIPQSISAGSGYRIRIVSSSPVVTGNDNGSNITVNVCTFTFNIKLLIQGFYVGSGLMRATIDPVLYPSVCDTVKIEQHNATSPFALVESSTKTIDLNGNGQFVFSNSSLGSSFYLVIKHRNAIETWSAAPVLMTSGGSYDFSTALNKAYGNNEITLATGIVAVWSGDINNGSVGGNKDGLVNTSDFNELQTSVVQFISSYNYHDLTGDRIVESADYSLIENNVKQNVVLLRP